MKNIKYTYLLLLFTFMLCASMKCKKELITPVPKLPAETQIGARTFGCFVDGKLYVPKGGNSPGRRAISTTIQSNVLNLQTDNGGDGINLGVNNLIEIGDYNLSLNNNRANYRIGINNYECILGVVTITRYDIINKIVSGRFFFTGKDTVTGKTVSVTEGRFDVIFPN